MDCIQRGSLRRDRSRCGSRGRGRRWWGGGTASSWRGTSRRGSRSGFINFDTDVTNNRFLKSESFQQVYHLFIKCQNWTTLLEAESVWVPGERARVVQRREDNGLRPAGEFVRRPEEVWSCGEKSATVRRGDTLQLEGEFQARPEAVWRPGPPSQVELQTKVLTKAILLWVNACFA